jgi:hypothetical protein
LTLPLRAGIGRVAGNPPAMENKMKGSEKMAAALSLM